MMAHFGFLCARYRFRLLTWLAESWSALKKDRPGTGERILILGEGESCQIASWLLKRGMFHHAFSIVGIVANEDPTKHGMLLNGCRVLGGVRDLPDLVQQYDVRMLVCTLPRAAANIQDLVLFISKTSDVRLIFMEDLVRFVFQSPDKPAEVREYLDGLQSGTEVSPLCDVLTGLPNNTLVEDRLRQSFAYSERYKTKSGLLLIDLDGSLDDERVEAQRAIEEMVKITAKRLMKFKRRSDTLTRFRTHEFALLLENIPDDRAAQTVYDRVKVLLAEPFGVGADISVMQPKIALYYPVSNMEDLQMRLNMSRSNGKSIINPLAGKMIPTMLIARHPRKKSVRSEKQ
jgi:diguanylate cyclase (GGDEF)-like protein